MQAQQQVVQNMHEFDDFMRDVERWSADAQRADAELRERFASAAAPAPAADLPPVRARVETSLSQPQAMPSAKTEKKAPEPSSAPSKSDEKKRISSYDYRSWDKYDADKATAMVDEEEERERGQQRKQQQAGGRAIEEPRQAPAAARREEAEGHKDRGNELFRKGKFWDAAQAYSRGMAADPANAVLPANRAMAYLKLSKFNQAEEDCTLAIRNDPKYVKAYYRRAAARKALKKYGLAIQDLDKVLEMDPANKEAAEELRQVHVLAANQIPDAPVKEVEQKPQEAAKPAVPASPAQQTQAPTEAPAPKRKKILIEETDSSAQQPSKGPEPAAEAPAPPKPAEQAPKRKLIPIEEIDSSDQPAAQAEPVPEPTAAAQPAQATTILVAPAPDPAAPAAVESTQAPAPAQVEAPAVPEAREKTAPVIEELGQPATAPEVEPASPSVQAHAQPKAMPIVYPAKMPRLPQSAPRAFFEFQAAWDSLRESPELRSRLLEMLQPSTLPSLFKDLLGASMLSDIVTVIHDFSVKKDKAFALGLLSGLSGVGRFGTLSMFLAAPVKQALRETFVELESSLPDKSQEIAALRAKWRAS
eukprot:m51a1_g9072 hypothetical protein (588) ;mRNA; r:127836-129949